MTKDHFKELLRNARNCDSAKGLYDELGQLIELVDQIDTPVSGCQYMPSYQVKVTMDLMQQQIDELFRAHQQLVNQLDELEHDLGSAANFLKRENPAAALGCGQMTLS